MEKNKQQLIEEAAIVAKAHQQKKEAVQRILNDLDKEEKMSSKHLSGIAAVNEILKEMGELESKHYTILEKIKGG